MKRSSLRARSSIRSSFVNNSNNDNNIIDNHEDDIIAKEQLFDIINNDTSWMTNAINDTCNGNDWNTLLDELCNNTTTQLSNMNYNKRFTELSDKDQHILIESQYQKMCDEESLKLSLLDFNFSKAIDNELVKLLRRINNIEHDSHSSNKAPNTVATSINRNIIDDDENNNDKKDNNQPIVKNRLLEVTLNAVIEALDNSPPEFAAAPKIFLNRPLLPKQFRPYVWNASLLLSLKNMDKTVDFSSISSILDEIIPRRCHSLLDKHYEKLSSRWMAGLVTETMTKFMYINSIEFPKNEDNCHIVDVLFFLIIPLIDVFSHGKENNENKNKDNSKLLLTKDMNDKVATELMIKALTALLSTTHMNLLKSRKGIRKNSTVLPRIEFYLKQKDEGLLEVLNTLHLQNNSSVYDEVDYPDWKSFFNSYLLKGLNGLLPHDTSLFVWDQGYIMSFHKTLSIVFVSLLISFGDVLREPVEPWPDSRTAYNSFCTYCSAISVSQLQKILSEHFAEELSEEFEKGRGYSIEDDNGILMAVYKKFTPEQTLIEDNIDNISISLSNNPSPKTISNNPSQKTLSNNPSQKTLSNNPSQKTLSNNPSQNALSNSPSQKTLSNNPSQESNISNKVTDISEINSVSNESI